jgi:hypothetical protein
VPCHAAAPPAGFVVVISVDPWAAATHRFAAGHDSDWTPFPLCVLVQVSASLLVNTFAESSVAMQSVVDGHSTLRSGRSDTCLTLHVPAIGSREVTMLPASSAPTHNVVLGHAMSQISLRQSASATFQSPPPEDV